ncbi:MAG TPA: SIMPL domain-containing protein [Candidatus Cybelea sp.]|jgi:hypothetical protein|nr:SIMPL domain-containing protein [Candidatus Cybelea sp.]
MKRSFLCLLAAFAVASSPAAAAQPGTTEITAAGTGSITLSPDVATVSAAIETNALNAQDAINDNNRIYANVVPAIEKAGVARDDIALSSYYVNYNPPPRAAPPTTNERYGYTVSRAFSVKVRDIGKAGAVSDACIGAGATAINGVSFGLSDPNAARAKAIARAEADARANAEAIAGAASLRVISIKSIELLGGGALPGPMLMGKAATTEFDQSNVSVTVSVSVVFLAQP